MHVHDELNPFTLLGLPAKTASLDVQHQIPDCGHYPFPSLGDFQCLPVSVSRAPVVPDCGCPFELLGGLLKPPDTYTQENKISGGGAQASDDSNMQPNSGRLGGSVS